MTDRDDKLQATAAEVLGQELSELFASGQDVEVAEVTLHPLVHVQRDLQ